MTELPADRPLVGRRGCAVGQIWTAKGKKVRVVWNNPLEKPAADEVVGLLEAAGIEETSAIEVGTMGMTRR